MGTQSSKVPGTPGPVYSGIEKLVSIFEGNDDLNLYGTWKDVLSILIDGLLQSPSIDRCYVSEMHIYKESKTLPFHEMLLFEIISDKSKYFMRVDRFVTDPNITVLLASGAALADNKKLHICHAEHQSQISLTDTCIEPTYVKALSATFRPHTASFRRLLDLLKIMSTEYSDYNVWDRSCYWFCSIIYRIYTRVYPLAAETKGKAHPNLGKLSNTGNGVNLLPSLKDQGKLYDKWLASKSRAIPVARFMCKETGRGSLVLHRKCNEFVVQTHIGSEFVVFSSRGHLVDNRILHIANGIYIADLNDQLINFTSHNSVSVDLRFRSVEQAQMVFEAMRRLLHGRVVAFSPVEVFVDRRCTSLMIAQKDDGPAYLEYSSQTASIRPNLELFIPLPFTITSDIPEAYSYSPLQLAWRTRDKSLLWEQEYILETSNASDPSAELELWTSYLQKCYRSCLTKYQNY